MSIEKQNWELKKFYYSLYPGLVFTAFLWLIKILEIAFQTSISNYGIYPRSIDGLAGILFAPLIHGSIEHLSSNSLPLIVLSTGILYFYPKTALRVITWIYIGTGIWVWIFARESYHIGASGLVYGFASYLFFSGVFLKQRTMMAVSMLIVFLYGGLIWGIFPFDRTMSFESHLLASIMGLIVAFFHRKENDTTPPQPPQDLYTKDNISSTLGNPTVTFNYEYKENK